jgi:hypothetical protein
MSKYIKRKSYRQKPIKISFLTKDKKKRFFDAVRTEYPIIKLKGEPIESFERVSKISEIILLGEDGEVRRIILR